MFLARIIKAACLLPIFCVTHAFAAIPLYQYYPNCDYQIIDTVKVSVKVYFGAGDTFEQSIEKARLKAIDDILELAAQKSADGIILTEKNIDVEEQKNVAPISKNRVSFSAQLVKNCFVNAPLSNNPTPFDEKGLKKQSLQLGTLKLSNVEYKIELNNGSKRIAPELASQTVDLESGVFGLPLGSSVEQSFEHFGTATANFELADSLQLVAYGRDFWLSFVDGKLSSVTNQNQWFTNTFLNMLAFDNRFESQQWQSISKVSRNMPLAQAVKLLETQPSSETKIQLQQHGIQLELIAEAKRIEKNHKPNYELLYYQLSQTNYQRQAIQVNLNTQAMTELEQALLQQETPSTTVDTLSALAIGQAWLDKDSRLFIMDNHLVVIINNGLISKIHILESVFNSDVLQKQQKWHFGELHQGLSFKKAAELLGNEVFAFDDMMELDTGRTVQQLFFSEGEQELELNSIEIDVF